MPDEIDVYKEWLGIMDGPRPPDHYTLLRLVQFEDSPDKIRGNYKKLNAHVRKYATGQYSVRSQELLNELAKAMLCLTDIERKREYDEGMGREFDAATAGEERTLEAILLRQKHVSSAQLKEAKSHADRSGLELRDALVQLKLVDATVATQAYAQELGLPYVDLADLFPDEDILDQIPRKTVKQYSILPLFIDEDVLLVAGVDQIPSEVEEELRLRMNKPVRPVLATLAAINQAINKYYAPGARNESAVSGSTPSRGGASTSGGQRRPVARGPLTEEEKKQRQQYGIILACWSVVLAYLLDWLLITPNAFFDIYTFLIYFSIVPLGGFLAWTLFWKK